MADKLLQEELAIKFPDRFHKRSLATEEAVKEAIRRAAATVEVPNPQWQTELRSRILALIGEESKP